MPKLLPRIFSVLLIPCLLGESARAFAPRIIQSPFQYERVVYSNKCTDQALGFEGAATYPGKAINSAGAIAAAHIAEIPEEITNIGLSASMHTANIRNDNAKDIVNEAVEKTLSSDDKKYLSTLRGNRATGGQSYVTDLNRVDEFIVPHLLISKGSQADAQKFLDAGSGTGIATFYFALKFGINASGVELNERQYQIAQKLKSYLVTNGYIRDEQVTFIHGNLLTIDFSHYTIVYYHSPFFSEKNHPINHAVFREVINQMPPGSQFISTMMDCSDIFPSEQFNSQTIAEDSGLIQFIYAYIYTKKMQEIEQSETVPVQPLRLTVTAEPVKLPPITTVPIHGSGIQPTQTMESWASDFTRRLLAGEVKGSIFEKHPNAQPKKGRSGVVYTLTAGRQEMKITFILISDQQKMEVQIEMTGRSERNMKHIDYTEYQSDLNGVINRLLADFNHGRNLENSFPGADWSRGQYFPRKVTITSEPFHEDAEEGFIFGMLDIWRPLYAVAKWLGHPKWITDKLVGRVESFIYTVVPLTIFVLKKNLIAGFSRLTATSEGAVFFQIVSVPKETDLRNKIARRFVRHHRKGLVVKFTENGRVEKWLPIIRGDDYWLSLFDLSRNETAAFMEGFDVGVEKGFFAGIKEGWKQAATVHNQHNAEVGQNGGVYGMSLMEAA